MFLLTASEVVLGTAIIMGLSALVTVLLRICTRPTFVRRGENGVVMPDEFGRMGTRVSLTSLQQRVMSKLRDRPPRYETRHNYEYQRRERTSLPATLNPAAGSNIPPPAYETGDSNSVRSNTSRTSTSSHLLPFFRCTSFRPLTQLPSKTAEEFWILRSPPRRMRQTLKVILMIVIGQVTAFYIFNRRSAPEGERQKDIFIHEKLWIRAIKS